MGQAREKKKSKKPFNGILKKQRSRKCKCHIGPTSAIPALWPKTKVEDQIMSMKTVEE